MEYRVEAVGGGVEVCVSGSHTFGTDAFLLSDFARPKGRDVACDLCSGCGIVPLLWFRDGGGPARACMADIQPDAVELARLSVQRSGLDDRVLPVLADLRQTSAELPHGGFDLVTCNPPYYKSGAGYPSREQSDLTARHETLCTLDDVCGAAKRLLKYGGRLCLCHLPERLADVMTSMRAHSLEPKRLRMVQQTAADPPWLLLVEGKYGARPSLKVEPPLLLRQGDGPSPDMARIYRLYGKVGAPPQTPPGSARTRWGFTPDPTSFS